MLAGMILCKFNGKQDSRIGWFSAKGEWRKKMGGTAILITGATGFVGHALARRLQRDAEIQIRKTYRAAPLDGATGDWVGVGDIGPDTDWSKALAGNEVVIHCAARVHVMHDAGSAESLAQFRRVNVDGTRNLARQAAAAGVRRLVFVSSIKVNGEITTGLPPFSHHSVPAPQDAYGISKWEAEQQLWQTAQETGLQVVVVRPPLVYGPGVKANFLRLMQAVQRGLPLPFGLVDNRRSMVYVDNLTDLLLRCAVDARAASQTFLASDGTDLSTRSLVQHLAGALGRPARLINVPPTMMHAVTGLIGKKDVADRLLGSLQVDSSHAQTLLNWTPPCSIEEGMEATAAAFLAQTASTG